jgi:prepilin-type N-terminal cleavage/methylation domain-containing protein
MHDTDRGIRAGNSGFSLIELLIVVAVIGISAGIATFAFNNWNKKSKVETQIKQMVSDINEVRVRALTTKKRHGLILYKDKYVFKSYSSEIYTSVTDMTGNGDIIPGGSHTVSYELCSNASGSRFDGTTVLEFDERGMNVTGVQPVFLSGSGVSSASVNCLNIYAVRVNLGKQNSSGACNDQ